MTLPAATFTLVAPRPDGLALAFTSARRRRNSKAAVSAFGGAVAIASALSFLTPPGQTLVQQPAQPAHGGLLPGLPDAPRHSEPALPAQVRTTVLDAMPLRSLATSTKPLGSVPVRASALAPRSTCAKDRMLACVVVRAPVDGGPAMHVSICPSSASVTVEYDAPPVGRTRLSPSHTVEVGSCPA